MIGYQAFVDLCQSSDSDERGHAAHLAALAYLDHDGPADEHAALYAALIGFLDDPSVKVRAALAYGLLHSSEAPRPIILALLRDSPIISRAVLQYSPVLVDIDLVPFARSQDLTALMAIAQRQSLSARIASMLLLQEDEGLVLKLLRRDDVPFAAEVQKPVAERWNAVAAVRGALLARKDLRAEVRLVLVRSAVSSLRGARIVKGALAADRLDRLFRDGTDAAVVQIGEASSNSDSFVRDLVGSDQVHARLLLHALVTGRMVFFSACLGHLARAHSDKVFTLLESGNMASLRALFSRAGLSPALGRLIGRLVLLARTCNISDDLAARHYVVTVVTDELLAEHAGQIPAELEEAFTYLSDQNITLAREAARGVMLAFADLGPRALSLPPAAPVAVGYLPAA